eukprot:CAMPEP_0184321222 /NCGR_PEP_ID=MMETSP1049-20130417/117848_1 /TAXON_ID=77928 /ORGANISM="Proteomonas sulcata, Strain CCMP704" /LENGTH=127 /DNA_ID=CAMNT_0026641947 /DNA_START=20 /DNA_END=403 /DNA_ORIENTATION=-
MAPYVSSKHCAVVASQALKTELDAKKSTVRPHVLCPSVVATPLIETSRHYLRKFAEVEEPMDATSQGFHERLNTDGMAPDQVADLVFRGLKEDRFFIITHPKITGERIDARYKELRDAVDEQPETGY